MGHDAPYFAAFDTASQKIVGVLPLVRVKSALFGHYLISLPFVNYGGPIGSTAAVGALLTHARNVATAEGAGTLGLRSRYNLGDVPLYHVSHRKITVLLDSSGGSDALWRRLPSKVRSQVRRPEKDMVHVRIGPEQADAFYTVFSRHMRDLGTPVMPWRFFEVARQQFSDSVTFAVAYHEGRPVACGAGFAWGRDAEREFEITWASSLREYNRMSPNMLVYWALMKHVADAGVGTFNFGRCTPGGNTHRFKTQWGTTDQPLWWYQYSPTGAEPPSGDSAATRIAANTWKRVPLALANILGPRLSRLIPL